MRKSLDGPLTLLVIFAVVYVIALQEQAVEKAVRKP